MSSFFVTGTDTGIGKTLVATMLSKSNGAHYWKPIQAGSESDSQFVASVIGEERVYKESYNLDLAASPNQAASSQGINIEPEKILQDWAKCPKPVIVEGAGGLLVPINNEFKMVDLISALNIPVILVARSGLGTLNHTFLSCEALILRSIAIEAIVLSGEPHPQNKIDIEKETGLNVIELEQLELN